MRRTASWILVVLALSPGPASAGACGNAEATCSMVGKIIFVKCP